MKAFLKSLLSRTPYRILHRMQVNRFQAVDKSLQSLRQRGFDPSTVIDGGANTGEFSQFALALFPRAVIHAIEPQPGCLPALAKISVGSAGRVKVHPVALCAPESQGGKLRLAADTLSVSTGAYVTDGLEGLEVPCRTLDSLFSAELSQHSGGLLKLDLQGYELNALRGAVAVLSQVEVVLTEVSFYAQAYEPRISELVAFFAEAGFELYDIAALYARPRDDRPRQGDFVFVRKDSKLSMDCGWS